MTEAIYSESNYRMAAIEEVQSRLDGLIAIYGEDKECTDATISQIVSQIGGSAVQKPEMEMDTKEADPQAPPSSHLPSLPLPRGDRTEDDMKEAPSLATSLPWCPMESTPESPILPPPLTPTPEKVPQVGRKVLYSIASFQRRFAETITEATSADMEE